MSSPLGYLYFATKKNAVRRFLTGLRKPQKALGVLLFLGLLAMVTWSITRAAGASEAVAAATVPMLRAYLALVLVMSVLSGFSDRGLPFSPAEVDFLFPGPFRRRDLVLYHLAGMLPGALFGALLPFLFFGLSAPIPALALLGCVCASLAAQNVRLFASLLAIHVGERMFRRLRGPLRVLLMVLTLALIVILVSRGSTGQGMREAIAGFAGSRAARVVLYPAVVAADLAEVTSWAGGFVPLLGAIGAAAATLVPVLLLQVNFLEESIGTSERNAARKARMQRSRNPASVTAGEGGPPQAVRLPALPVFRGAGAIAWKNLVIARRSLRALFFSTIFLLLVFVPAIATPAREGRDMFPLAMVALFPLLLSTPTGFDFRGEAGHLATLKALPISSSAMAAAQIAVPTLVILLYQGVYLLALAVLGRVASGWVGLAWLGCVPVTATMVAAMNLAWFVGSKGVGAALLQVLFIAVNFVVLAMIGAALAALGVPFWPLVAVVALAQVAIFYGLLLLLGVAFSRHDVADAPT